MPRLIGPKMLWALLLLVLLAACGESTDRSVVARITLDGDTREVTVEEFDAHAAFVGVGTEARKLEPGLRLALAENLVRRAVLLGMAAKRGVTVTDAELNRAEEDARQEMGSAQFLTYLARQGIDLDSWRREQRRRLLAAKALDLILASKGGVTPREIEAYYQEHRDEFQQPEQVLAQHALLPDKKLAQNLVDRVVAGQDLARAAADMGIPLPDHGRPAWLSRGHMPEKLESEVFALKPGKVAGPLNSPYGYHVVMVLKKRPARSITLGQAAPKIQKHLLAERREEMGAALVNDMLGKSQVWYNQNFLATGLTG